MSTLTSPDERTAEEFAAAVRGHLSDISTDELDELLDGLAADLLERVIAGEQLGEPEAYAEELRQAAGIPPRSTTETRERKSLVAVLSEWGRERWQKLGDRIEASTALRAIRDFLVALRPVWWIVRAAVLTWFLLLITGAPMHSLNLISWAFGCFIALAILSVQWGRGKWVPNRALVWLRRLGTATAVVLLLPALIFVDNNLSRLIDNAYYAQYEEPYQQGLVADGRQITNIFAFDCSGQPIAAVQLFDQNGDTISTHTPWGAVSGWDETRGETITYAPNELTEGSKEWNAFPLNETRHTDWVDETLPGEPAEWPFLASAPLSMNCPVDEVSDGEGAEAESATTEAMDAADVAATEAAAEVAP